jgi:hypothetical protein
MLNQAADLAHREASRVPLRTPFGSRSRSGHKGLTGIGAYAYLTHACADFRVSLNCVDYFGLPQKGN